VTNTQLAPCFFGGSGDWHGRNAAFGRALWLAGLPGVTGCQGPPLLLLARVAVDAPVVTCSPLLLPRFPLDARLGIADLSGDTPFALFCLTAWSPVEFR
jgi:hypothetical protein